MTKKFKTWEEQSHLNQIIKEQIGNGIQCTELIGNILRDHPKRYADFEILLAVDELLEDFMIIAPLSNVIDTETIDLWLVVTECANEEYITKATSNSNMSDALLFLMKQNVWHPDMDRYGMTEEGEDPITAVEKNEKYPSDKEDKISMSGSTKVSRVINAQSDNATFQEVPDGAERFASTIQDKLANVFNDNPEDEIREFSVDEIAEKTKTIEPDGLATEIGSWIVTNVEQFIDNHEHVFRMYLPVCAEEDMPNCSLFQRLYMSVPDVDDLEITGEVVNQLWDALDDKLAIAKSILDADSEFNTNLFKRMSYFYELTGFMVGDGQVTQAITQDMQGRIKINELMFDPIVMTTTVSQGVGKNEAGIITEGQNKVVIKQEELPAGFAIELEICLKPKKSAIPPMY
jgi:hypothetical protein